MLTFSVIGIYSFFDSIFTFKTLLLNTRFSKMYNYVILQGDDTIN